jgi:Tetratricopeptide repeat/Protein of unknown function (DUF2914)
MPDTRDPRSVLDAAEQAAANNDYESAERLLREAAGLQEETLGPLHPDLANTFNNLGVVCEITKKPEDAEQFYRRAVAIASATLEPDHPDLARTRKNLEDFCAARGKPVDLPVATPTIEPEPDEPPAIESTPVEPPAASPELDLSLSGKGPVVVDEPRRYAGTIGMVIAAVLLAAIAVAVLWLRSNDAEPAPPERSASSAAAEKPAPPAAPEPAAAAPKAAPVSKPSLPSGAKEAQPLVATARLCQKFSTGGSGDWSCVPVSSPVAPGALVFYTRLKSPQDTTVEHRWYHGGELRQTRRLSIETNTDTGYRTYSRYTADRSGEWRVELRSRDGALLHEERFVVR